MDLQLKGKIACVTGGSEGIAAAAAKYADFAMRQQYKAKDPRGWEEFRRWMSEHSAEGHALTMLHVQLERPTRVEPCGMYSVFATPKSRPKVVMRVLRRRRR